MALRVPGREDHVYAATVLHTAYTGRAFVPRPNRGTSARALWEDGDEPATAVGGGLVGDLDLRGRRDARGVERETTSGAVYVYQRRGELLLIINRRLLCVLMLPVVDHDED